MALNISDLNPAGSDLFADTDSFLSDLQETEAISVYGGKNKGGGGSSKGGRGGSFIFINNNNGYGGYGGRGRGRGRGGYGGYCH